MTHLKNWQTKFATTRPRRLLALDGGGIRGVMSLEILRKIERDLAAATGKGASFRLGDFFDYIGGTPARAPSLRPASRWEKPSRNWSISTSRRGR
jgi:hypothetical protein